MSSVQSGHFHLGETAHFFYPVQQIIYSYLLTDGDTKPTKLEQEEIRIAQVHTKENTCCKDPQDKGKKHVAHHPRCRYR